jgi:hypothetical protein
MTHPNCCERMKRELERESVIKYWIRKPESICFGDLSTGIYLISDGGHGGMELINFCPWCGALIN